MPSRLPSLHWSRWRSARPFRSIAVATACEAPLERGGGWQF